MIEPAGGYEGQEKCDPDAEPGVIAFRSRVLGKYPWTGDSGISRGCSVGGQSEHKEGRAWDWRVNAGSEHDVAAVKDLFSSLFAKDEYGNEHALARRLGVMYLIWNRKIWFPGSGWRTYCVQKPRGCVDEGDLRHPHTDHVHFSFTWDGAKKNTTYYKPSYSFIKTAAGSATGGLLLAGGNGGVRTDGVYYYGDLTYDQPNSPVVAAAVRPNGDGYWLATESGKLYDFGYAPDVRGASAATSPVADIASTPNGNGLWIVTRSGELFARGNADNFGQPSGTVNIAAIAPTITGQGYWLATTNGRVLPFGDATEAGDLSGKNEKVIDIAAGATGYWLATKSGRVVGFGGAPDLGGVKTGEVIGVVTNASKLGYRVVLSDGQLINFGE
jgi:hypothetical protein